MSIKWDKLFPLEEESKKAKKSPVSKVGSRKYKGISFNSLCGDFHGNDVLSGEDDRIDREGK